MPSTFTFSFLPSSDEGTTQEPTSTSGESSQKQDSQSEKSSFSWLESRFHESLQVDFPHDLIHLSQTDKEVYLRRVREIDSSSSKFQNSDLVPGVYEGGLKVWECSIDLCRYLQANNIIIEGSVLELGCGHGLPGCLLLKQARSRPNSSCSVVLSDFNQFVLNDVTIANIVLNTRDATGSTEETIEDLASWLSEHAALGAGDWNIMSEQILQASEKQPLAVPSDGRFDVILAAETTYSEAAAKDTARLLVRHLRVGTGVAYIATKRYYFGVGGGSDCFRDALAAQSSPDHFKVETIEVYDSGEGNIRELLQVQRLPR
jgi:predicted nicotinamide N-methyase